MKPHEYLDAAVRQRRYTLLCPSSFMDILARAGAPMASDTWGGGGAAGEGRVNLIDRREVADVARIALLDTDHLGTQRAYHLTGPAAISMPEAGDDLPACSEDP